MRKACLKKCYITQFFYPKYLQITKKSVPLHCVFHSIRFKVNKGWSKALLLFLCPYVTSTPLYRCKPIGFPCSSVLLAISCVEYSTGPLTNSGILNDCM